ncbi:MAG: amidohydrolase family protein [Chloroflexi bacterium]|nr:amidohydrolase family protein [Chloroflexota bacterium]MDA1281229.1 amidohydrolase family protein [Chloroflexota bacterium]
MPTSPTSYDLVISGGRVLDPANNVDAKLDIAVSNGKIAAVEANIDASASKRVVDASGLVVTSGLIDLHTHAAGGIRKPVNDDFMVDPDTAGVSAGITTILDAGSIGALNSGGLVNYLVPNAKTRLLALLNIGKMGVANLPEVKSSSDIDHASSVQVIQSAPNIIKGVKARMVTPGITALGNDMPKAAKAITDEAGGFVMVHVGDIAAQDPIAADLTPTLLTDILTKGDVVTHTLSGAVGALLADGSLISQAQEARNNGVYFDVGVGGGNFTFASAQAVIDQGFMPDTISSDITAMGIYAGPVFSLTECMGKVMTLGISFEDAIKMTTSKPAEILGIADDLGSLSVGTTADISIVDLVEGDFSFIESSGTTKAGSQAIKPVMAIKDGVPQPLDHGPRPWGWLPAQNG